MQKTRLKTQQLGTTGLEITRVGFGAWAIGGGGWEFGWGPQDDEDSIEAIHRALELGVNWIDTAAAYGFGRSELIVGRALEGLDERPYVFTKASLLEGPGRKVVHRLKRESILREAEASLERLGVDAIDLYQIHWPIPEEDVEEGWSALAELKEQGLVRHIGVSNFSVEQLRRIQQIAPVETLQPQYSLVERGAEDDVLPYAELEGIGVIVYSPMGSGLLTGRMTRERIAAMPNDDWRKHDARFREPQLSQHLALVERLHTVAEIGRAALIVGRDMRVQIAFIGETSAALWFAIKHPHRIRWKDVWYTCEQVGVNALPIVALISFLLGIILAFQSAVPMKQFGAEIFVADLVGLSILRELGPLMTAILLAGRSGAAFAAEIGTMKVNEELNALTTMGLDPVRFLVVTRIVAAVLMMPLLVIFADLIGILGGALTMISFNIPISAFLHEVDSLVDVKDLLAGLAKAPVFAILIAGIGCLRGLQTQTGASAVGISATRAVVSGIILLVVVDGIYAFVYYLLDI